MRLLAIISILCKALLAFGQEMEPYEIKIIPRIYSCDTIIKEWKKSFDLGLLPINLKDLTITKLENEYKINGTVATSHDSIEVPNARVYLSQTNSVKCDLIKLLAVTDEDGKFIANIDLVENNSLFFTCVGYESVELKFLFNNSSGFNNTEVINNKISSLFYAIQESEQAFLQNHMTLEDFADIYMYSKANLEFTKEELLKKKSFKNVFEELQKENLKTFKKIKSTGLVINWRLIKIEAIKLESHHSSFFNKPCYKSIIYFSSGKKLFAISFDDIVEINGKIQIPSLYPPYEISNAYDFDVLMQKKQLMMERCLKYGNAEIKRTKEAEDRFGNVENACNCTFFELLKRQDALNEIDAQYIKYK